MMSQRQRWLYWREVKAAWIAVRERESGSVLPSWRIGSPPSDWRHSIHVNALGRDKSSTEFNNRDLDKVLAELRAISDPGNLNAQLHQLNQERNRLLFGIRKQAREIATRDGRPFGRDSYIYGIIKRMNAEGQLGSSDLEALGPDELRKVRIALTQHERRGGTMLARNYELRPA